ncbi:MAG: hypothetical protein HYT73_02935 [Candidatus Aenigmarchaeota archaeon]|nr:hypothetical protein [Candidatus Aenigmarchaeota archaeon]
MPGLEDKLKEIEERINRLENKMKLSLFEVEKLINQPKQEEPVEDRLLEMEDLILLMQLEVAKIKDKVGQDIDVGLTPKVSPSVDDRLTRIEEEISNVRQTEPVPETHEYESQSYEDKPVHEEARERRPHHVRDEEPHERPQKKRKDEEEETIRVKGNVLEDLQKILNK